MDLQHENSVGTKAYSAQCINKKLVHKRAISEVFITSIKTTKQDQFLVTAQLPRTHMYFNDNLTGYYDAILLQEIFRQAAISITHQFYQIPFSNIFIIDNTQLKIKNHQLLKMINYPADVFINIKILTFKTKRDTLTGLTLSEQLYINNLPCAHSQTTMHWLNQALWTKLRKKTAIQSVSLGNDYYSENYFPLPAFMVGKNLSKNVVATNLIENHATIQTTLGFDPGYSALCDHEVDHISGMVLVELCKQTALIAIRKCFQLPANLLELISCSLDFNAFCELGSDVDCVIDKAKMVLDTSQENQTITFPIVIKQNDKTMTSVDVTFKILSN